MSVMHRAPLQSGFLADKFHQLEREFNMHMLVWDSDKNIETFSKQTGTSKNKIHIGLQNRWQVLTNFLNMLFVIFVNRRVRTFLLSDNSNLSKKIKLLAMYLPIFYVKPNIVHFEFGTLATDIATLKKVTDAKIIVSFRGYDINYVGLENEAHYTDVWRYADGIHFLGNDLKQRAIRRGYNSMQVEALIPAAIDTSFFHNTHPLKENAAILTICSTGRLTWKKGYEYAIQAMAILKEKNIPLHYYIAGEGNQRQALQFTIAELGLTKHITLLGSKNKDSVKHLLEQADVFIQPSISEGFCNAVLEAQAMEIPVIATDADGLAENIENGQTGFIVPKWNAEAIAERLVWCYNNRATLITMGGKGAERVRTHFDIHKQTAAFIEFYNKVHEA